MAVLMLITTMSLLIAAVYMTTTGEARYMKRSIDRETAIAYGDGVLESLFDQWRNAMSNGQNLSSTEASKGLTGAQLLASPFSLAVPSSTVLPVPANMSLTSWSVNAGTPYGVALSSTSTPTFENGSNSSLLIRMYYIATATVSFPHGSVTVQRTFTRAGKNIFNNFLFSAQPVTEIDPGAAMYVNGTIYAGGNLYAQGSNLNLQQDVSYTGSYSTGQAPDDNEGVASGTPNVPSSDPPHQGTTQMLIDAVSSEFDPNYVSNGNYYDPTVSSSNSLYATYQDPNDKGYHELIEQAVTSGTDTTDPLQVDTSGDNERLASNADYSIFVDANNNVTIYKGSSTTPMTYASNPTEYNAIMSAIITNTAFYDGRVGDTVRAVTIDVGALTTAYNTGKILDNNTYEGTKSNDGLLLYVDDTSAVKATITGSSATVTGSAVTTNGYGYSVSTSGTNGLRTTGTNSSSSHVTSSFARGVRLVNGGSLPSGGSSSSGTNTAGGLTIASPNPVYIQGDFNTGSTLSGSFTSGTLSIGNTPSSNGSAAYPSGTSNPTNVSGTYTEQPAVIAADAVTILSNNWADKNSGTPMNAAANTTINTAIVAGNVPTAFVAANESSASPIYSGGIENFPRLLEDWSTNSNNLTIHGSFGLLYNSEQAVQPWKSTGNYYNAPNRRWFFDSTLQNHNPPGFPAAYTYERGRWQTE